MDQLTLIDGRALAANGDVGVVMLLMCGEAVDVDNVKYRWFEYVVQFFEPPARIEWSADSMIAVLPFDSASHLIEKGYARAMNDAEVTAYNAEVSTEAETSALAVDSSPTLVAAVPSSEQPGAALPFPKRTRKGG